MLECLVNGEISNFIAASNRGLNYADGVFETLVVQSGHPLRWQAHMDRLGLGCERLGLAMPPQALLLREVQTISTGYAIAVVKIVLTREGFGRGYTPPKGGDCTRIITVHPYPDGIEAIAREGVTAKVCETRLALQPALGGIKHLDLVQERKPVHIRIMGLTFGFGRDFDALGHEVGCDDILYLLGVLLLIGNPATRLIDIEGARR